MKKFFCLIFFILAFCAVCCAQNDINRDVTLEELDSQTQSLQKFIEKDKNTTKSQLKKIKQELQKEIDVQNFDKPLESAEKKVEKRKWFVKKKQKNYYEEDKGYFGQKPDIESQFEHKRQSAPSSGVEGFTNKEIKDVELQNAPVDDPLFLDVVIKKDKNSQYVNDLIKTIEALEKLRYCIINQENIQKFNANVNIVDLHTRNIEKNYSDKPESMSESYAALRRINYQAKSLGNLKFDANFYSRYMPTQNTAYAKRYIETEDEALLKELERTIFILKQAR